MRAAALIAQALCQPAYLQSLLPDASALDAALLAVRACNAWGVLHTLCA